MNELIKVQTNEQDDRWVSARDLYKAVNATERFSNWTKRYITDDFFEGIDYKGVKKFTPYNSKSKKLQELDDYSLTVETAKQVAQMQHNEYGKKVRLYLIGIEKEYKQLLNNPKYQMAMGLRASQLVIEQKDHLIEEMKPKAIFADAVTSSKTSILVGDLAKLLKQNGVDMGGRRLFEWLRNKGYLIRRNGADYNSPTQRSMEQGLFEIKESSHINGDGVNVIKKTPKVTGKGQQYFINKFLGSDQIKLDMEAM